MRPIYVESADLSTDHIGYARHDEEAVLAIGPYRLPTSTTDLGRLKADVIIFKKIADAAEHAFRDLTARIAWLENQEEQRRLAAAHNPVFPAQTAPATQPSPMAAAPAPTPCRCGEPATPSMVHRVDGPCHPIDTKPCPSCNGNGCATCAGRGIAILNPPQGEPTRDLRPVPDNDSRPAASTSVFQPPARPKAATPPSQ